MEKILTELGKKKYIYILYFPWEKLELEYLNYYSRIM